METTNSKIQIYLDPKTSKEIKRLADKKSISISKYAARVLEDHLENISKNEVVQTDTQAMFAENKLSQIQNKAMLAQILSCVYDFDVINGNAGEVKELMRQIESQAKRKVKKS